MTARGFRKQGDAFQDLWRKSADARMDDAALAEAYGRFRKAVGGGCRSFGTGRTWLRYAASVALAVAVGFVGARFVDSGKTDGVRAVSLQMWHTAADETRTLSFDDGSTVRLGPGSVLVGPVALREAERKMFLVGEAFFDVAHDAERPFRVTTRHLDVTDLGTSFMVTSYLADDVASVTLKSGAAELRVEGQEGTFVLAPNDQVAYNAATRAILRRRVPDDDMGESWRNRRLVLDDVALGEAVETLGRCYGTRFTLRTGKRKDVRVRMTLNRGETLERAMGILSRIVPGLGYEICDGEVFID